MDKLQVVLFKDGRPGHEKQSVGILQALEKYIDLNILEFHVQKKGAMSSLVQYLRYFLYFDQSLELQVKPDLVIGTGSQTHLPVLSCKRQVGGRVVTSMSPGFLLRYFDLCFVPFHDQLQKGSNIFQTIGPPNTAMDAQQHNPFKSLLLIGGEDNRSHQWEGGVLLRNIKQLLSLSSDQEWIISSSPRTPQATEELLHELAVQHTNVNFIPFSQTGIGWVEQQYAESRTVWVTGDSISMVYEALSAGCSVGILPIKWHKKENKFCYSLQYLVDKQRVITLKQHVDGESFPVQMEPLHEADRCAREILKRWWPENLR